MITLFILFGLSLLSILIIGVSVALFFKYDEPCFLIVVLFLCPVALTINIELIKTAQKIDNIQNTIEK